MIDRIQTFALPSCDMRRCPQTADDQEQVPMRPLNQTADTVRISKQGREYLAAKNAADAGLPGQTELDPEQQREIDELKKTV